MENCYMYFEWHLSKDFEIAKNKKDEISVIPHHANVIAHFANCEIFQDGEVVGWITVMELCETDLRKLLENDNGSLSFDERKKIAIGVKKGDDYLQRVGIRHFDMKPENVLMKNGIPKFTDFGLIAEISRRESYRQLLYARRGSKFSNNFILYAGSPAFTGTCQLDTGGDNYSALGILILCEWNTAWTLIFKPLEIGEKEKIKKELQSLNAGWMTDTELLPQIEQIEQLTGTVTVKNASTNFALDKNLTKSCVMAQLKQRMTRVVNFDFRNLTKNVLDQKDSNLCVPSSVSVLLRWAIKNDLNVEDTDMEEYFTVEKILTNLTMIIYPRSLAGMNLNPKNEEKEFQHTEIELLLNRMKNETYLHNSGWDIIGSRIAWRIAGSFDFNHVLLHTRFTPTRPLTVTSAYAFPNGEVFFHQMILDRVENDEYVLQNTLHSSELESSQRLPLLRIDRQKRYYVDQKIWNYLDRKKRDYIYRGAKKEFMLLTSAGQPSMNKEEFYLLPQAYSITLTPT